MATEQPVSLGVSHMEVTLFARLSRRATLAGEHASRRRIRRGPQALRFVVEFEVSPSEFGNYLPP
jgi:hypothetical protein